MNAGLGASFGQASPSRRPRLSAARILAAAAAASFLLTGCTPTVETHGYSLEDDQLARIKPGSTSRQEVMQIMGSPSTLSSFDDNAWYYVSQRTENRSFYQEEIVAQDVIAISFDDNDTVAGVERHGLEETASIEPVERVTPTAGASPSIFEQLIGNIGRFSGSSVDPDS